MATDLLTAWEEKGTKSYVKFSGITLNTLTVSLLGDNTFGGSENLSINGLQLVQTTPPENISGIAHTNLQDTSFDLSWRPHGDTETFRIELPYDENFLTPVPGYPQDIVGNTATIPSTGSLAKNRTYFYAISAKTGLNYTARSTVNTVTTLDSYTSGGVKYINTAWSSRDGRFEITTVSTDNGASLDNASNIDFIALPIAPIQPYLEDHTESHSVTVTPGGAFTLEIQTFDAGSSYEKNWGKLSLWIDWNHDGQFDNDLETERYEDLTVLNQNFPGEDYHNYQFVITPPQDAIHANTRMRIRCGESDHLDGHGLNQTAGPALDFSVQVVSEGLTPVHGFEAIQIGTKLSWSVTDQSDVQAYQIVDIETGEIVETIVTNESGHYEVELEKSYTVKIVVIDHSGFTQSFYPSNGNQATVHYNLTEGWNLISIPVENCNIEPLLSISTNGIWVWDADNYTHITESCQLSATTALWIMCQQAHDVKLTGKKSDSEIVLTPGWNMIGSVNNQPIPANALTSYSWDKVYKKIVTNGTLLQGVGYWIFSN